MDDVIRMLTARLLMTPTAKLTCAATFLDARNAMTTGGFEIVPKLEAGRVTAYWHTTPAGNVSEKKVALPHVVSDGCDIPSLIAVLAERRYVFVVGGDRVVGYVHFSDLNRPQVKVPLFVLFEELERVLVELLEPSLTVASLRAALPRQAARLLKLHTERHDAGADHSLASTLSFTEVLRAAQFFRHVVLEDPEIKLLGDFRNLVAHAGRSLVRHHDDVKDLAACQALLRQLLARPATTHAPAPA